ncbi:hypothetical protein KIW84_023395 [Lathyrus oleraceus]|uniref:Uncharacterized protein n=1 Tax=Pisum sativum TaxID=3888 RepID=A0A9D5B7X5_PEA|nr:hypothetical protein KIW84_023395 [Pisum sativum]
MVGMEFNNIILRGGKPGERQNKILQKMQSREILATRKTEKRLKVGRGKEAEQEERKSLKLTELPEELRIEMAGRGRDDAAIAEALGMLAGVLGGNPNVVGMGAARQLSEFQKNNPPMFKGA